MDGGHGITSTALFLREKSLGDEEREREMYERRRNLPLIHHLTRDSNDFNPLLVGTKTRLFMFWRHHQIAGTSSRAKRYQTPAERSGAWPMLMPWGTVRSRFGLDNPQPSPKDERERHTCNVSLSLVHGCSSETRCWWAVCVCAA